MTDTSTATEGVARCTPRQMQRATIAESDATPHATLMQRPSLRGLALLALGCNAPRNAYATPHKKGVATAVARGIEDATPSKNVARCVALGAQRATDASTVLGIDRPVVAFRLACTAPNSWAMAIGAPGESLESLGADLRWRWSDVEVKS